MVGKAMCVTAGCAAMAETCACTLVYVTSLTCDNILSLHGVADVIITRV